MYELWKYVTQKNNIYPNSKHRRLLQTTVRYDGREVEELTLTTLRIVHGDVSHSEPSMVCQ